MPLPSLSHSKAFLIGLVVSCCRGKKSVIEGEVEADDSDVSDDEYVHWSEAFSFCSSSSRSVKGIVRYKIFCFFFPRQTSEWKPAGSQLIYCFRGVFTLPWCPVGLCSALTRHIPPRNETDWLLRRPHSILLTTLALRETFSASLQTFTVHLFRNSENVTFELIYKLEIALTRLFLGIYVKTSLFSFFFFFFRSKVKLTRLFDSFALSLFRLVKSEMH